MQILRWQKNLVLPKPSAIVIGNFDGVHLGHQAMLHKAKAVAEEEKLSLCALSFFPHTKALTQGKSPQILSNLRDRGFFLAQSGVENWILLSFREEFRRVSAEDFVRAYLLDSLNMRYILVGEDFRFGYQGSGDFALLEKLSAEHHFRLEKMLVVQDENAERISSSAIRSALENKNFALAAKMLGRCPSFTGKVRTGAGRGRELLARTANLHIPNNWAVPDGVYAVEVEILDTGKKYPAVANIGAAPTFASLRRKIEAHLLDYQENLYRRNLRISVQKFLRSICKFSDAAALQEQIQRDIAAARDFFHTKSEMAVK